MYPYPPYLALKVLYDEKLTQCESDMHATTSVQPVHLVARSLARTLGHTFLTLGTRLEHYAQVEH